MKCKYTPCHASSSSISSSETYFKDSIVSVKLSILCHPSDRKDHLPPAVQLHSLLLLLNLYLFIQESTTVLICLTDDGRGASSLSLSRALIILLPLIVDMYYYCTTTTTVQDRLYTERNHKHIHTSTLLCFLYQSTLFITSFYA